MQSRVRSPDAGQETIQNSARVTSQAVEPNPHCERSLVKFLKRRALAAAGSVARGRLPTQEEKADPRGRAARGAHRPPTARARPTLPRPSDPPGGLCAGLCRADRFSAAAFSRTVAMSAAGWTPCPRRRCCRCSTDCAPAPKPRVNSRGAGLPAGSAPGDHVFHRLAPSLCAPKRPRQLQAGGVQVEST